MKQAKKIKIAVLLGCFLFGQTGFSFDKWAMLRYFSIPAVAILISAQNAVSEPCSGSNACSNTLQCKNGQCMSYLKCPANFCPLDERCANGHCVTKIKKKVGAHCNFCFDCKSQNCGTDHKCKARKKTCTLDNQCTGNGYQICGNNGCECQRTDGHRCQANEQCVGGSCYLGVCRQPSGRLLEEYESKDSDDESDDDYDDENTEY